MARKYRQQGYQDTDMEPQKASGPKRRKEFREGPRAPQMPGMQRVVKCSSCGSRLSMEEPIVFTSQCTKCNADLHTCRNCVKFNPTAQFECVEPITKRISPKHTRAKCEYFKIRETVEKITTSNQGAIDPRDAFENLFKS
jgi:hypothetical protein